MEIVGTLLLLLFSFGVLGPGLWFYLRGLNGYVADRYVPPNGWLDWVFHFRDGADRRHPGHSQCSR